MVKEGYKLTITLYPNQSVKVIKSVHNIANYKTNELFYEGNHVYRVWLEDLSNVVSFINEAINHKIEYITARNKQLGDELAANREHIASLKESLNKPIKIK
jgi:hypothetical protein